MIDFLIFPAFLIGSIAGIWAGLILQSMLEIIRIRNSKIIYEYISDRVDWMFSDIEKFARGTKESHQETGMEYFSMHISQLDRLVRINADTLKPKQREELIDIVFYEERRIIMAKQGKRPLSKNHYENLLYLFKEIKWLKIKKKKLNLGAWQS